MDISRIDYWATSGKSILHRASAPSKILATALIIASVIILKDLPAFVILYVFLISSVRLAKVPVLGVVSLSMFAGVFAILYAISQSGDGYELPLLIVMKALTAASAMILLISTTPYADVLNFVGRFLPRVVKDGLFMTYRSFFILLELLDHLLMAFRLRGGFQARHLVRNGRLLSSGVGILFLRAYDKSQRLYDVMTIRGYSGSLAADRDIAAFNVQGIPYLAMAAVFLVYAILAKKPGPSGGRLALIVLVFIYLVIMEAHRLWKR